MSNYLFDVIEWIRGGCIVWLIIIGDGCWLVVNVIVLLGVIIGVNMIIGGGSVVIYDILVNVIVVGNFC